VITAEHERHCKYSKKKKRKRERKRKKKVQTETPKGVRTIFAKV
jgi:hypothetical protein